MTTATRPSIRIEVAVVHGTLGHHGMTPAVAGDAVRLAVQYYVNELGADDGLRVNQVRALALEVPGARFAQVLLDGDVRDLAPVLGGFRIDHFDDVDVAIKWIAA